MTCFTIVHSERSMELAFNKDALQFEEVSDIDWCRFESVLLHISTLNFVFVSLRYSTIKMLSAEKRCMIKTSSCSRYNVLNHCLLNITF